MAEIEIETRIGPVRVSRDFLRLPPDEQRAFIARVEGAQPAAVAPAEQTPMQRLVDLTRAAAQGLTLGAADEIEAAVRNPAAAVAAALGSGGQPYYDTLRSVRQQVESHRERHPVGSAVAEVLGSVPLAAVGGKAAVGRTAAGTIARMAGAGAGTGAATGFLSREGDERLSVPDVVQDVAIGAVAAPALYGAMRGAGGAYMWLRGITTQTLGRRAGPAVEAALRQVVEELGIPPEEAVARIAAGEALSDNASLHGVIRRFTNQLGAAAKPARDNIARRVGETRAAFMDELNTALNPTSDPNVARAREVAKRAARGELKTAYDAALQAGGIDTPAPPAVADKIKEAFTLSPAVARQIQDIVRIDADPARRVSPYFTVSEAGEITFTRQPTIREAEITRRALSDHADGAYTAQGAARAAGPGWRALERELRTALDEAAPDLAAARAAAAVNRAEDDAYTLGQRLLTMPPDHAETEIVRMVEGKPAEVVGRLNAALRAGYLDAANARRAGARAGALADEIASPDRAAGRNLAGIVEPDAYDSIAAAAQRASRAATANQRILVNAATSEALLAPDTFRAMPMADTINAFLHGETRAMIRVAGRALQSLGGLSDAEKMRMLNLLTTDDAELVKRALDGEVGAKRLLDTLRLRARQLGLLGALEARGAAEDDR